jgi:hypothetical protein
MNYYWKAGALLKKSFDKRVAPSFLYYSETEFSVVAFNYSRISFPQSSSGCPASLDGSSVLSLGRWHLFSQKPKILKLEPMSDEEVLRLFFFPIPQPTHF